MGTGREHYGSTETGISHSADNGWKAAEGISSAARATKLKD